MPNQSSTDRVLFALVAAAGAAGWGSACLAQCTSTWDPAIGLPGIAGGYAAALRGWDGGGGARVYVGGSFTSAGGLGAARYLAAWNPGTGAWAPVGGGISGGFTNAFMTSLTTFDPGPAWPGGAGERLVVGGFFDNAGGVPGTASLAMWNGTTWEAMGTTWTGSTRGSVWSMAVWNGRLYIGGGVVNQPGLIAGLPWNGIASWDGQAWQSHAMSLTGFSPNISALQVFNDGSGEALYASGRFDAIDGVPQTALLAKYNGEVWSSVGGGVMPTSPLFGLEGLTLHDDGTGEALYVAGYAFAPSGQGVTNVAKWNGTAWSTLGGQIGTGRLTSIASFDDGTGAGPQLYIGGTAMPQINYFARWDAMVNQWLPVDGGITGGAIPPSNFPSVFGLSVVDDALYVAGNFVEVNSIPAKGLAARTSCASACYANCDGSTVEPVLNVDDFTCFINEFAAGQSLPHGQQVGHYANCDGSTVAPVLNVDDFTCFINEYAAGCS